MMEAAPPIDLFAIASERLHEARERHRWALMSQASREASLMCDEAMLDIVIAARDVSTLKELVTLCS
jgi:hypothetical protein